MEKRTFSPHQNLIIEVIKSQAGTLGKAILEGAMNSIDAGASECHIDLSPNKLTIKDDGKGFVDRSEIELFFEVFGQPHEEGDATYGRFRMGRGQLFSFGRNNWHSNQFKMEVDIEKWVLEYRLKEDETDKYDGCHIDIDLYEELDRTSFMSICTEIREYLKFAQIPIHFNGECISKDPKEMKWDKETDDCYFKSAETGSMSVYNLGVLVSHMHYYQFGMGGTVVSKKQLQVNFARNDVMSKCPVWKRIKTMIDGVKGVTKKKSMNDDDRLYEAKRIMSLGDGEISWDDLKLRLVTDVAGKQKSLNNLLESNLYSVAKKGDIAGDSVHQSKSVFVMATETLDRFGVNEAEELVEAIVRKKNYRTRRKPKYIEYDKMIAEFGSTKKHVEVKKYSPKERVWISLAKLMYIRFNREEQEKTGKWNDIRDIRIGKSDQRALAWTDGNTYICFDRQFVRSLRYESGYDIGKFASVLLHEYCHRSSNLETDVHGEEFYELFHELAVEQGILGQFFNEVMLKLPDILEKENLKENKRVSRFVDKTKKTELEADKAEKLEEAAEIIRAIK